MPTIVGARRDAVGNSTALYDTSTQETLLRLLPAVLDEDFLGPGHSNIPSAGAPATAYPWVSKLVKTAGSPSVAVVANAPGGVVQAALDATSELQEATLYANDMTNWSPNLGLMYENRLALSVLPTGVVEGVWGMQSAWISGPDNAVYYARFQVLASGAVNIQTKDGVSTKSFFSGVTLLAGGFHIFKIDMLDPTNVMFSIDGVTVSAAGQMTFAASGSILQPYLSVYKANGVGVGSIQVDMIQVSANRV